MAEAHDLSPTDASNTGRFPENQAPSTVNNGARALEGLIARYLFDQDTSVVATLSGSVIQVTANRNSITLTATTSNYVANLMQAWTMGSVPNTGPASLNIDAIGPISLRDNRGASLSSSVLLAGTRCLAVKDDANNYFRLLIPHHETDTTIAQALQAAIEAETNENTYIPPDLIKHSPGVAKFWVNFNGTGAVAITLDYNVDSITDNGTGDYTVNITTDFSGVNWPAIATANQDGATSVSAIAAGTVRVLTYGEVTGAATLNDSSIVSVAGFGDQA